MNGETLRDGLLHGGALCGLMTVLIVASLRQDPLVWLRSSPKDVQAFVGPPPPSSLRRRKAWGGVMALLLLAVFGHLAHGVVVREGGFRAAPVAVGSFVAFQVFNLYDALVIDLGLVLLRPRWAFVEGTADLPGLRDPRWHLGNYAKGVAGGFLFAGLVTVVAWAVARAA